MLFFSEFSSAEFHAKSYLPQKKKATEQDRVHVEWYFRSGLDRYVWIYGMLLAWLHPHIETMWDAIEKMEAAHRNFCRASIAAIASAVMYFWCALLLCAAWHSNLLSRLQSVVMYLLPYLRYNTLWFSAI
jgi:hypothetical protein